MTIEGGAGRISGGVMRGVVLLSAMILLLPTAAARAGTVLDALAAIDADVLFIRHADAPGFGDPANFTIGDCATQRNLDAAGRRQARNIGERLKREGVRFDAILSSQWCRCIDTASEMQLGRWDEFAGLNSFFQGYADRDETLRLLSERMRALRPGELTLMVTHYAVISVVTGISPPSGGMVAYNSKTGAAQTIAPE